MVCSCQSRMLPLVLLRAPVDVNTSHRYWGNCTGCRSASASVTSLRLWCTGQWGIIRASTCLPHWRLPARGPGRRKLRSSRRCLCTAPCCNSTFGQRSFCVAGPRLWNDLPKDLRNTGHSSSLFSCYLDLLLCVFSNLVSGLQICYNKVELSWHCWQAKTCIHVYAARAWSASSWNLVLFTTHDCCDLEHTFWNAGAASQSSV